MGKILLAVLFLGACSSYAPPRQMAQTLFVAFDGVPHELVKELHQNGALPSFAEPSEIISPFPSTTTAGFTGLFRPLGAGAAPGYDAMFYDWKSDRTRGSLLEAYDVGAKTFSHFFTDMRSSGFEHVVMYTLPQFAMAVDLARIKPALWNAPEKENLFFYLGATDATGHLDGREKTEELFLAAIRRLEKLKKEYETAFRRELRLVLFSDHGFFWGKMLPIDIGVLETRLREKGFELGDCCLRENPNRVIPVTWGNISGGEFYLNNKKSESALVEVLLETEGVDLVMILDTDRIRVLAQRGGTETGEIFLGKNRMPTYRPIQGDPLQIREEIYPDAVHRIWDAFFGLAQNQASILISTGENYEYGDNATRFGAAIRGGLRGTHGSLRRASSSAFLMTDDPKIKLPKQVSYDKALTYFMGEP